MALAAIILAAIAAASPRHLLSFPLNRTSAEPPPLSHWGAIAANF
ncbi:MAG: hypothetical protein AAF685_01450 [Cyanobacteria bacterium P01_C01_bin.89]